MKSEDKYFEINYNPFNEDLVKEIIFMQIIFKRKLGNKTIDGMDYSLVEKHYFLSLKTALQKYPTLDENFDILVKTGNEWKKLNYSELKLLQNK